MFCSRCGKPIDGEGRICPECAAKISEQAAAQQPVNTPEDPTPVQEQVAAENTGFTVNTDSLDKPAPKKKTGLIALIASCAAVLLIGIICLFNWPSISSLFNRNFLSPDDYLHRVEEKNMGKDSAIENISALYGQYRQSLKAAAAASESDIRIRLDDSVKSMLQTALRQSGADFDIEWISDLLVEVDYNVTESGMQGEFGFGLSNSRILTFSVITDYENGDLYVGVPELSDTYLKVHADYEELEAYLEGMTQSMEESRALADRLPDEKEFEEMLRRYVKLVTDNLREAEKSTEELSAGVISQEVTALTTEIHDVDARDILIAILKEAQKDPTVKEFASATLDYINGLDPYAMYDIEDFYDSLEDAIASLKDIETGEEMYLIFTTYVDKSDKIVGRRLTTSEDDFEIYYYTVQQGDNFAFEAKFSQYDEELLLVTGSGYEKKGLTTGQYTLTVEGKEVLLLDLDEVDTSFNANGKSNGTVRLTLGRDIMQELLYSMDRSLASMLQNTTVAIEITTQDDTASIRLILNDVPAFTIDLSATQKTPSPIKIPSRALDVTDGSQADLLEWVANLDFSGVIEALEKKNAPQEIIDALKEFQSQIGYLSMIYGI